MRNTDDSTITERVPTRGCVRTAASGIQQIIDKSWSIIFSTRPGEKYMIGGRREITERGSPPAALSPTYNHYLGYNKVLA